VCCDLSLLLFLFFLLFLLVHVDGRTETETFAIVCREYLTQRVAHGDTRCQMVQPPTGRAGHTSGE